jgi:hypothetical protein
MKLQMIEEPQLAFHESKLHIDIRAGLSKFGAFDKGSTSVPVPNRCDRDNSNRGRRT